MQLPLCLPSKTALVKVCLIDFTFSCILVYSRLMKLLSSLSCSGRAMAAYTWPNRAFTLSTLKSLLSNSITVLWWVIHLIRFTTFLSLSFTTHLNFSFSFELELSDTRELVAILILINFIFRINGFFYFHPGIKLKLRLYEEKFQLGVS